MHAAVQPGRLALDQVATGVAGVAVVGVLRPCWARAGCVRRRVVVAGLAAFAGRADGFGRPAPLAAASLADAAAMRGRPACVPRRRGEGLRAGRTGVSWGSG